MIRNFVTPVLLLAAITLAGCSSDDPIDTPTQPTPVAITETFNDSLNVNGARTHRFNVDRAGTVTAQIKALSDQAATIGISLGAYNGTSCAILISKTDAVLNSSVIGTAQSTGAFCVWVNDVGKLTAGIDYTVDVTHF